jgi:hypothetical protein
MRFAHLSTVLALVFVCLATVVQAAPPTDADYERWNANWDSLVPPGAYSFVPPEISDQLWDDPLFNNQLENASRALNTALLGTEMELAGFMVPIRFEGDRVYEFLLVPEAGQCIHVPPPPLNQTVLVDLEGESTAYRDLYDPVVVTGKVVVGENSFELADSGYTLVEAEVESLELE